MSNDAEEGNIYEHKHSSLTVTNVLTSGALLSDRYSEEWNMEDHLVFNDEFREEFNGDFHALWRTLINTVVDDLPKRSRNCAFDETSEWFRQRDVSDVGVFSSYARFFFSNSYIV